MLRPGHTVSVCVCVFVFMGGGSFIRPRLGRHRRRWLFDRFHSHISYSKVANKHYRQEINSFMGAYILTDCSASVRLVLSLSRSFSPTNNRPATFRGTGHRYETRNTLCCFGQRQRQRRDGEKTRKYKTVCRPITVSVGYNTRHTITCGPIPFISAIQCRRKLTTVVFHSSPVPAFWTF